MTHVTLRTFAAIVALALSVGALGCAASAPEGEAPPEGVAGEPQQPAPPPTAVTPEGEPKPTTIQAQGPEWEKIAQELARGRTVEEQQQIYQSQEHYRLALAYHNKGDFEKARIECQKAVQAWHENLEARKLLAEINMLVVGGRAETGARTIGEDEVNKWKTRIEQAQIEITTHIRTGERYYNARMYDKAVEEFETAQFKILHIPYDVKAMQDLLPAVADYINKSRNAKLLEDRIVEEEKRRVLEAEAAAHEVAMRREITRKIAHLLELAYMAFDQKRFDRCAKLCDEILLVDPHYTVAKELKEDAYKTRHKEEYYNILAKKVEEWKKLTDSDEEAVIPYSQSVRFPSREQWAEISKRITQAIIKTGEGTGMEEDPDVLAINRKLETMKIDMSFENSKLEDILAFVRDFTGLNILLDASVRDRVDLEKAITFKVKDLVLKNVLKLLLAQFGLDYVITEEKVVLLTTPDKAHGRSVLELHDIRDILVKLQDFAGPRVELVSPQGGMGGPLTGATFTLDEPKEASVGEEQIVDLIRENIAPGTWEGEQTIEKTPNQQLLVNAPPQVHRELREFLGKLRSYTGTMVSVVARFVAAYDDYLDDVGVDIINRANAILAGNDYETNDFRLVGEATGEFGPGFLTQESARLESYDLRAQTFHTLLKYDPIAMTLGSTTGTDPLANRLTPQGGLGLQYQWIGEQALSLALRALHKGQKATLVHAPRVTVFNTQRSHVMFLTQLAYIMDYEPQVSTLAAAYDPVIGILTHGAVLDVRPIVSNDRKYVTMELRPSFAELQAIRRVDIRPGLNIWLDLPWVVLQKAETTVTVPDRGTLMISGFKDILMRDMHSGVPFLENIPILNFFMTRKAKADEKRRLFILVTPEIIDLAEREAEQF